MNLKRQAPVSLLLFFILFSVPLYADRTTLPIQAFMVDKSTDEPVEGSLTCTFKIYSVKTGGEALFSESKTVTFDEGVFNTSIAVSESVITANESLFLGIRCGSDSEFSPRLEYHTTPYSVLAYRADTTALADVASTALAVSDDGLGSGLTTSGGKIVIDTSDAQTWTAKQTFAFNPADTTSANAVLHVNPTSSDANDKLLAIRDNGTDRFTIDKEGDTAIVGTLSVTGAITLSGLASCDTIDTNSSGLLSCGTDTSGSITADSLNFTDLSDSLTLDASTLIAFDAAEVLTFDASTADTTTTGGVLDINVDSQTNGAQGINLTLTAVDDDAADTLYGFRTDVTVQDDTTATDTAYGNYVGITQNDTSGAGIGVAIVAEDAGASVVSTGLLIENLQATDIDITDAIKIQATTDGSIATALNLSDNEITTAIAIGSNDVTVGGVTIGSAEFAYLDTVSSNIQTQLNAKSTGTLTSGSIFVGSAGNVATAVAMSGDATIANTGALTISAGAVGSSEITDDTVASADIAADTIVAGDIATGAVATAEILDGTVASADIADATIVTGDIATDTIIAGNIAAGAVATSEILDDTIASADIAADTIVAGDIATGAVATAEILDNTITATDLNATITFADADLVDLSSINASGTGEGLKLPQATDVSLATAEGQISWDTDNNILYVGDGAAVASVSNPFGSAIDSSEITDGTVASADIAAGTITTTEIATDTIAAADIAAGAVGTSEIADGTVASADIADGTVVTGDIATDTILAGNIAAGAVGTSEIADGTVASADVGTDLDFADMQDTLDLDASLTLNQSTNTWSHDYAGTTQGTGFTYTADDLTTSAGMDINITRAHNADASYQLMTIDLTNTHTTASHTGSNIGIGLALGYTQNPATSVTTNFTAMRIRNEATADTDDVTVNSLLTLDNADTSTTGSTVVTNALTIVNSGDIAAGITNAINVSDTDITNDLSLQNTETIDNDTDDMIELQGVSGSDNTDLRIDLDGTAPVIDSPTDTLVAFADDVKVTKADPSIVFDVTTATDTDFWIGVTDNGDGVDNDLFQIGDGTTPGTNAFVTVNTSGYVGMGTANPLTDIDIRRDALGTGAIVTLSGGNAAAGDDGGGIIRFLNNSVEKWRVDARRVDADGTVPFRFLPDNGGTPMMILLQNGRVGIGDASPDALLDVERSAATVVTFNRTTDDGTIIGLEQAGTEEGTISVSGTTVSYNAFTGSHYGWTDQTIEKGMLVKLTGENRRHHDNPESEIVYGIEKSQEENDPAILGAYLSIEDPNDPLSSDNHHLVMAVGNGVMWVVNNGKDLQPGDYLISSGVPGHAMLDPRTDPESHIIAKVAEPVQWDDVSEKHKLVSVLFTTFVRYNPH